MACSATEFYFKNRVLEPILRPLHLQLQLFVAVCQSVFIKQKKIFLMENPLGYFCAESFALMGKW
jgi:hypothetical protein